MRQVEEESPKAKLQEDKVMLKCLYEKPIFFLYRRVFSIKKIFPRVNNEPANGTIYL